MLTTCDQSSARGCSSTCTTSTTAVNQRYLLCSQLLLVFVIVDLVGWVPAPVPTSLAFSIQVFSDPNCTLSVPLYDSNYPSLGNTSGAAVCVSNVYNTATNTVVNLDYSCEDIGKDNDVDTLSVFVATYNSSVDCNTNVFNASTWVMYFGPAAVCDTVNVQTSPFSDTLGMYARVSCDSQPQTNGVSVVRSRAPWYSVIGLSGVVLVTMCALLP